MREQYGFMKTYEQMVDVLKDQELASMGDAYVNFVYSLAISNIKKRAMGTKVKGRVLAEALKKAGLRRYLPSRMATHRQADAAEALIVYGWLKRAITLEECVKILTHYEDPVKGFSELLQKIGNETTFL